MRGFAPDFIWQQLERGEENGRFQAATLFVDISGFTTATESLIRFGKSGSEALADTMRHIFTPLIETVNGRGGFVTGFAGDAFTAVFPITITAEAAEQHAIAAGWEMLQQPTQHQTPFGDFTFPVKVGVDFGDVTWGILREGDKARTHYFKGEAINGCSYAEHRAQPGQLILSPNVKTAVSITPLEDGYQLVTAVPTTDYVNPIHNSQFTIYNSQFPNRQSPTPDPHSLSDFRYVLTCFLNFQGEPTRAQLTQLATPFFQLLDQYDGTLGRLDFGDKGCNLLLFWGAPIAHENDVERAIHFVQQLRQLVTIPLRAGLTYQLVYAGFAGSARRFEYTCYGMGVNLAARLMMAAPWGEIWLDEAVQQRVDRFETAVIDHLHFKGFQHKQPVYVLRNRRPTQQKTPNGSFLGRQAELAQLETVWDRVKNGRRARSLTILGEAGMGKSQLVRHFMQLQQYRVIFCQTDEIVRQSLNPFRTWLRHSFGQRQGDLSEENDIRFERQFANLLAQVEDGTNLQEGRPFLRTLLDLPDETLILQQLEPRQRFDQMNRALEALLLAESGGHPLLFVLEDAHWLDEESQQVMVQLMRRLKETAVLFLLTSRAPLPWLDGETMTLLPLDGRFVAEVGERFLGHALPDVLIDKLQSRSDGNPLFVTQMLTLMRQRGKLPQPEEMDDLFPADVQALLTARLDQLPNPVRRLVQTASVLGRTFDTQILAQMVPDLATESAIEEAKAADIWQVEDGRQAQFHHALLRDAAYEMQSPNRLRHLHHRAARAIESLFGEAAQREAASLAYHYFASVAVQTEGVDRVLKTAVSAQKQHAFKWLMVAGNAARDQYGLADALRQFERAEQIIDASHFDATHHIAVEAELGETQLMLGNLPQARYRCEEALKLLGLQQNSSELIEQQAEIGAMLGQIVGRLGELLEALRINEKTLALLEETAVNVTAVDKTAVKSRRAKLLYQQGTIHNLMGNADAAIDANQKGVALAQTVAEPTTLAHGHNALGVIYQEVGRYGEAVEAYEQSLTIWESLDDKYQIARLELNLGTLYLSIGKWELAERLYHSSYDFWKKLGDQDRMALLALNLGNLYLQTGVWERSEAYCRQALMLFGEAIHRNTVLAYLNLGLLAVEKSDWVEATAVFQKCHTLAQQLQQPYLIVWAHYGLAEVALGQNKIDEAERLAQAGFSLAGEKCFRLEEALLTRTLGKIDMARGDLFVAEKHLRSAERLFAKMAERHEIGRTRLQLALLAKKQNSEKAFLVWWETAVAIFKELGAIKSLELAERIKGF